VYEQCNLYMCARVCVYEQCKVYVCMSNVECVCEHCVFCGLAECVCVRACTLSLSKGVHPCKSLQALRRCGVCV
jgi:hypothetical protein